MGSTNHTASNMASDTRQNTIPITTAIRAAILKLPIELRLSIYELYFAALPLESPEITFYPHHLQVNHQIYYEALGPYQRRIKAALFTTARQAELLRHERDTQIRDPDERTDIDDAYDDMRSRCFWLRKEHMRISLMLSFDDDILQQAIRKTESDTVYGLIVRRYHRKVKAMQWLPLVREVYEKVTEVESEQAEIRERAITSTGL